MVAPPTPAAGSTTVVDPTLAIETDAVDAMIGTVIAQNDQSTSETATAATSQECTDVIHINDSSDWFVPTSEQDHAAKKQKLQSEKCAKKKAERTEKDTAQKKVYPQKAMMEGTIGYSVRLGPLLTHMLVDPLGHSVRGWSYGRFEISHIPKTGDDIMEESDSDDDEIMNSYEDLMKSLTNTSQIQLSHCNASMQMW